MSRFLLLALISQLSLVFCDTNYRLNTPLRPKAYFLAISPYFDTKDTNAFTFLGEVEITFTTTAVTKQIKLHSEDLVFNASNIQVVNALTLVPLNDTNPLTFDTKYTFVYINLQDDLQVGDTYNLLITYQGPIREDLKGFYRSYYIENGVKKWLGATQMEPTHARKVFPCFDEPEYKATFSLSIDRPGSYSDSLANTKRQTSVQLADGYVREIFYPTPIMSTYLVAFLVSEFQGVTNNETNEFGIYTRPEALNQTSYAMDFGMKVAKALGDYFGIDYYSTDENLKLDHIALPDFNAGAMENWGLIKYRESYLLYVPEDSTPTYKYRVAQIIAHETTHMWFGDLVTCHWWSNTWLNEGFANYFQDYITATVDPSVGSANALVTGSVYAAYNADSSSSSSAITNDDVNSPAEISEHFGTITYQKAGSVIRMIHHLIGDEGFRHGLHNYLETNKFSVGYPEKLYAALEIGVRNTSALSMYPNTDITEVMSSWISQAGHPVLHVEVDYSTDKIVLTQKRFYTNFSLTSDETYNIPITYATGVNTSFTNTKPAFVMKNKTHEFLIDGIGASHTWVIFNVQETGLYRVNYDDHSWEHIAGALKGSDREKIHPLNRAKIVNDLFAFIYSDQASFHILHDVLEFMSSETDYSVWYAAIEGLNKLWNAYQGSDALPDVQAYALKIVENGINKLGYEVGADDDYETLRNRMQILTFACKLGHQGCVDHMVELFRQFRDNDVPVPPSLRPAAYCHGLRHGNGDDYEFLWSRLEKTNVASEARTILEVLGCTSDEGKLRSYLVSMEKENSPIRTQDLTLPLSSVLAHYRNLELVMGELKGNYSYWSTVYETMDTVLSSVGSVLHTEADFVEFEEFLSTCSACTEDAKKAGRSSMSQAKNALAWAENHKAEILVQLRSSSTIATPSMILVVTLTVALESLFLF